MNDLIITKVDKARHLLAQARNAKDAKQVVDLAHAAEIYARRRKLSEDAIHYATGVKVDAMTLMGEFLKQAPKNEGTKGNFRGSKPGPKKSGSSNREPPDSTTPTQKQLFGKNGRKVAMEAQNS